MRAHRLLLAAVFAFGCSSSPDRSTTPPPGASLLGPTPPPTGQPVEGAKEGGDPWALKGLVREEWLPLLKGPQPTFADVKLAALPKGVPAPPKTCEDMAKRVSKAKLSCSDKAKALEALDKALDVSDPTARDEALVALEGCSDLPAGFVRSLRIEIGPPECGDALAVPVLTAKPAGMPGAVHHVLVGQALAARLHRAVANPPKLAEPYTKQRVSEFVKGPMMKWFKEQAVAVQELAKAGSDLAYYGKGIVALAAGNADLRMVEVVRDVPIPDEFRKDPELANAYYGALDIELEPRKTRGRDGALVGLREMAHAGVVRDRRVETARALLAKLYGGRRVDALDILALPALPDPPAASVSQRLAAKLPAFHVGLVLDPAQALDAGVLRAMMRSGFPVPHRVALKESEGKLGDDARAAYARGRLAMGVLYWRAEDFDAAASLFSKIPRDKLAKEDRLALALSIALRRGPDDVAALMLKNEGFSPEFGDVRALDIVAAEDAASTVGAFAAFDAAVIRQIGAPRDAGPKYWEALGERYAKAAGLLADGRLKREADERARAALATAKAIGRAAP